MLLAGKYLNVIRECGIEIVREHDVADEDLAMDDERQVNTYIHPSAQLYPLGQVL